MKTTLFRPKLITIHLLSGFLLLSVTYQAKALNPIQIENAIPPVASDYQWTSALTPSIPHTIEGYADQTSVSLGSAIKFYVNANSSRNATYKLTIYRLGYYSGAGARQIIPSVILPSVTQTLPTLDPVTGLAECNWVNPYALTIPANWVSGVYVAVLVGTTTGEGNYIPFVVKQPASTAAYVFQTGDTTWQAYNAWGGKSLYAYNSTSNVAAVKVSYNRPYDVSKGLGILSNWELRTLIFLEQNGYDVTYQSDVDTHNGGVTQLLNHKAYLSVGHDEYWSKAMRDNVQNARAQGLSLGFLGANAAYWQIRFESSPVTAAANRTIVAYKEKAASDPIGTPALVTGQWRDPLYANRPENALIGLMYTYSPVNADIVVTNASHWAYTGTGLQNGSKLIGLLGYEIDAYSNNGLAPAGLQILAHSPDPVSGVYGDMSIYTQTCSVTPCVNPTATVFASGSMQWAWGLNDYDFSIGLVNPAAQQMTHNILTRMVIPNAALPGLPPNAANVAPTFVGGSTALTIAQNTPIVDLKPNLHVSDANVAQTETWSQNVAPLHGTLTFSNAIVASGPADITPGGTITYQPTNGYSGTDSFTIKVSDGIATATRTFTVNIPSAGLGPNLIINPSLEADANNDGRPDCWQQGGYGTNTATWARTSDAYGGNFAQSLQITSYTNGDRKLVPNQDTGSSIGQCAPLVTAGANYKISAYYKSTASVGVFLYYLDAAGNWQYWKEAPVAPASSTWTQVTYTTGVLPTGAKAFSFGLGLRSVGTLITDDYMFAKIL